MKYLNTKPGSIEEVAANMSKYAAESEYQQMFKKELEKAGKGIGSMTPAEKKAFFNKIDSKYTAKNEETINENASQVQVKRDGKGNFNLTFKGKEIGYYHKSGSKYMVYYDNEDGDYNQSDEVSSEMQAKKLAYDNMNEMNEKKNYKRDSNFFVNDKTDTLKKMSGRQGYNKSTLTDYLAQKSNKKENDVYFDDTDLVYKSKTVLKNAETKTVDQMLKALQKEAVDNPYAVGMAQAMKSTGDKPPLKKATITKAHDIAKSIEKDQKEEVSQKEIDKFHTSLDKLVHKSFGHSSDEKKKEMKNETHSFVTNKQNEKQKKADGEKDIVDPAPEMKKESLYDSIKSVWQMSAEQLEKIKSEAKYYKKEQNKNDLKSKKVADTGSETTPVDTEPKVDYTN